MKKDSFFEVFLKTEFDEITIYLKDTDKLKYSIIFTFGNQKKEIYKVSSKQFLKDFIDVVSYKIYDKEVVESKVSKIDDKIDYYGAITNNGKKILLLSETGLDNEYFNKIIQYIDNKRANYMLERFNSSLLEDKIKVLNIQQVNENDICEYKENEFQYMIPHINVNRKKEYENIYKMFIQFLNKYKTQSNVSIKYMMDMDSSIKAEITLTKEKIKFDNNESKVNIEKDIRKILISGREIMNILRPKIKEIEKNIEINLKLKLERE